MEFLNYLKYIYQSLTNFFSSVVSVLSYIRSVLESVWYGLTTLLSGIGDMIQDLFTSGLF